MERSWRKTEKYDVCGSGERSTYGFNCDIKHCVHKHLIRWREGGW